MICMITKGLPIKSFLTRVIKKLVGKLRLKSTLSQSLRYVRRMHSDCQIVRMGFADSLVQIVR